MAMGDGGEPAARPAFQSVWFHHFDYYPHHYPVGNNMVRDIEFYGVCGSADVPAPEGGKESSSGLGIGNLFCAVYPLQADTVWLYRDWGRYVGSGSILFHKDSDTVWFSFSRF